MVNFPAVNERNSKYKKNRKKKILRNIKKLNGEIDNEKKKKSNKNE